MCNVLQHVKMNEMPRNNVQAAMRAENNLLYAHIHFLSLHNKGELVKIAEYMMYVPTKDRGLQWNYGIKQYQPYSFRIISSQRFFFGLE